MPKIFSAVKKFVLGAQKNNLIEMGLLVPTTYVLIEKQFLIMISYIKACIFASTSDFVFISYAQKFSLHTQAGVSSGARGLHFGLSFHLHPFFEYVISEGSNVSAYSKSTKNHLCWFICILHPCKVR